MPQHVKLIYGTRISAVIFCVLLGFSPSGIRAEEGTGNGIPFLTVANFIHGMIEADRTLYTTHVVDRMQETGTAIASEGWNAMHFPSQHKYFCCQVKE